MKSCATLCNLLSIFAHCQLKRNIHFQIQRLNPSQWSPNNGFWTTQSSDRMHSQIAEWQPWTVLLCVLTMQQTISTSKCSHILYKLPGSARNHQDRISTSTYNEGFHSLTESRDLEMPTIRNIINFCYIKNKKGGMPQVKTRLKKLNKTSLNHYI